MPMIHKELIHKRSLRAFDSLKYSKKKRKTMKQRNVNRSNNKNKLFLRLPFKILVGKIR